MDSLQKAVLWFAAAVVFAGLALSAQASGKTLTRLPRPADRESRPLWFWLEQILLILFALGFVGAAAAELMRQR